MARSPSRSTEAQGGERSDAQRDLAAALHEVSNALTVVLGWLEAAREEVSPAHPARRAVDVAWSRAKLARKIARQAIGDDTDALEQEADLESVVRDAVTGVEREAGRRRVEIGIAVGRSSRSRIARGAPALLQVLTNLLLNAISMSPDGGKVRVKIDAAPSQAQLVVEDEGPGIPAEMRPSLFKGGVSRRKGGTGIGLCHAHQLAASSGGELSLAPSVNGAEFRIVWPLIAVAPVVPRTSTVPNSSLEGVRILVLEDDEAVIGLLTTALSLRGAEVTAARSAGELEAAVEKTSFDAALLDLSPIAADIGRALASVRERNPRTKLVLISGSSAEVPATAASLMSAWVRKPFEVGEILAVLRSFPPESG